MRIKIDTSFYDGELEFSINGYIFGSTKKYPSYKIFYIYASARTYLLSNCQIKKFKLPSNLLTNRKIKYVLSEMYTKNLDNHQLL